MKRDIDKYTVPEAAVKLGMTRQAVHHKARRIGVGVQIVGRWQFTAAEVERIGTRLPPGRPRKTPRAD